MDFHMCLHCFIISGQIKTLMVLSRIWLYLVDVQGLHGIFYKLNVDLCLLWLKLLIRNELSL